MTSKPFFYTSFVSTIDGKVWVNSKYWPIGSQKDYQHFTKLRSSADLIVDGKNTALKFGKKTIDTIKREKFKAKYVIISRSPDQRLEKLGIVLKDITSLLKYIKDNNFKKVFIEGGPNLIASFLKKDLLDEINLTISPKIFGNNGQALTMVEGYLFPVSKIKKFKLVSVKKIENEVFLKYRK